MDKVRLGIVGLGNMGLAHRQNILDGKVPGLEVTAVCEMSGRFPDPVDGETQFTDTAELIGSGRIDAIHICTPHFSHTTIGQQALEAGLHVMVEKPLGVHKADCEKLIAAWEATGRKPVFAAMFNQRTNPLFRKLKDLIDGNELGEIRRIIWQVTDWFRTEFYYASGGWRATWKGEGGGVLLNQCPHNLDLFQWLFGMPDRVTGFCNFGRYHQIEVEDDVTAHLQWKNGKHATFITSTGESPGVNRLEVTAENGLVILENETLSFKRNRTPVSEFSDKSEMAFATPEVWYVEVPVESGSGGQHVEILQNFTNAILHGETLISPAEQGIRSVELANSILFSAWQNSATIDIPIDSAAYEKELLHRGETSTFKKREIDPNKTTSAADFSKSFK
ncbi:MAG: Gfo/Idh/MocA family oxidoreductase [Verrucomicrobiota bacterium]